ncbi:MAG: hypothetical protein ACE5JI_04200 [Acidobacteriota bacterium]
MDRAPQSTPALWALRLVPFLLVWIFHVHLSEVLVQAGPVPEGADIVPLPRLSLVWYDPDGLLKRSYGPMKTEVEGIFDDIGVTIDWLSGRQLSAHRLLSSDPLRANVVLLPVEARAWNLGESVMGATMGAPGKKPGVYVFFPNVARSLGLNLAARALEKPRAMNELARAVARVVAHEIVHFLAPGHPHRAEGLMGRRLTRSLLLRRRVGLDGVSARALVAALRVKSKGKELLLAS